MTTQHKGIRTLAIEGFYENLKKRIEANGSHTFTLKAGGKIKPADVSTWAEKEGYRQSWEGDVCTIKRVVKMPPNFWTDLKNQVEGAGAASIAYDPESSITRADVRKFAEKNNFLHEWTPDGLRCNFARKPAKVKKAKPEKQLKKAA